MKRPSIKIDYSNMMSEYAGASGLSARDIASAHAAASQAASRIRQKREDGLLAFMYLPYDAKAREEVKKTAELIRGRFDTLVLAGTDPALTAAAGIINALKNRQVERQAKKQLRVMVIESGDPSTLYRAINVSDFKKTVFNICVKSPLSDTDAAMIRVLWAEIEKKAGKKNIRDHVIITTDSEKNRASELARAHSLVSFLAPSNVSGAFSVMSAAGLLPLACSGAGIDEILKGAAHMDDACTAASHRKNPAYMTALLYYLFDRRKKYCSSVFVPGCPALKGLLDWMTELWADSLTGKGKERPGMKPFSYTGPKLSGDDYAMFGGKNNATTLTFLNAGGFKEDFNLPAENGGPESERVLPAGKMSKIVEFSRKKLESSLAGRGVPNMSVTLPFIDEFSIGQFICLAEAQAVFMAEMYGAGPHSKHIKQPETAENTIKRTSKYII